MNLVVAGKLNKQIAGDVQLAEATVKLHRAHMMQKMHAASVAELVKMAGILGIDQDSSHGVEPGRDDGI